MEGRITTSSSVYHCSKACAAPLRRCVGDPTSTQPERRILFLNTSPFLCSFSRALVVRAFAYACHRLRILRFPFRLPQPGLSPTGYSRERRLGKSSHGPSALQPTIMHPTRGGAKFTGCPPFRLNSHTIHTTTAIQPIATHTHPYITPIPKHPTPWGLRRPASWLEGPYYLLSQRASRLICITTPILPL